MSSGSKLPNSHLARVEEKKIKHYLLKLSHLQGGPKARFFTNRGFSLDDWTRFQEALISHGTMNKVINVKNHNYGKIYIVECNCTTPDGQNPCIRSVWQVNEDGAAPRLITAHPISKASDDNHSCGAETVAAESTDRPTG